MCCGAPKGISAVVGGNCHQPPSEIREPNRRSIRPTAKSLSHEANSLRGDLHAAKKSGVRTAILVTLLVSGVVPALHMIFPSSEQPIPFSQHLSQLASVVLHTYPLTLAIALITLSRRQKWLTWGKWFFAAMVVVIFGAMGNTVGEFIGHGAIQPASIFDHHSNPLFGIPANGINYLAGFYQQYGFRTFVASLLVGTYAGSTATRFLRHVPKDRSAAVGLARELVDASRKAA